MRGDRRSPVMVVLGSAAGLLLAGGVVSAGTVGEAPAVEGRASVAGSVDGLLSPVEVTQATVAQAAPPAPAQPPVPTTRPPAPTAAPPRTTAGTAPVPHVPPALPLASASPPTTAGFPPLPVITTVPPYPPNGPVLPVVNVRLGGQLPDGSVTVISGDLQDVDGWIRVVTVDWGDGTPLVNLDPITMNGGPCPMAGWTSPLSTILVLGDSHHYATAGPRVITVTATSTSCDGVSDRQTGVGRVVLSAPAP